MRRFWWMIACILIASLLGVGGCSDKPSATGGGNEGKAIDAGEGDKGTPAAQGGKRFPNKKPPG